MLLLQEMLAPQPVATELAAALLQAVITAGLAALCLHLYARFKRPWFAWFAAAWAIYVARLICILNFLLTGERVWLYWHQVTTGWTALVLLWASIVFLRQPQGRPWWALLALFPPLWSYVAIYRLDHFLWAALPAVLFLSGATIWTGLVFWRHHRVAESGGARLLAFSFVAWGLHHLDYPFLRARGAWNPWGYYLDISFELLVGAGLVILVLDDLKRGLRALTALSGDLQRHDDTVDPLDVLLSRPLTLPGVSGSAIYIFDADADAPGPPDAELEGRFVRGAGNCAGWTGVPPESAIAAALGRMRRSMRPQVIASSSEHPFIAALPLASSQRLLGALVMAGEVRNPFTALDDDFLLALGQQVGAALEQANLDRQLAARTGALEQLSMRMVRQHEEERRRLSRELHDETAQVFTAVRMQLEALRSSTQAPASARIDRLLELVDTGIRSIRNVTNDLRPSLLDDLGLIPALRSLASDFAERTAHRVTLHAPDSLPPLPPEADLALFRALQEALSNVARHAQARHIEVVLEVRDGVLEMRVLDDGGGFPVDTTGRIEQRDERMGLTGMRERILAVGGSVTLANRATSGAPSAHGGAELRILVPVQ
jgi:signal transduction histidine kinase